MRKSHIKGNNFYENENYVVVSEKLNYTKTSYFNDSAK